MDGLRAQLKIAVLATVLTYYSATTKILENPEFSQPIVNVTVAVGREAILECVVQDLSVYKVAWLRVDTQTILTIQSHVITKNHRIGVTHSEHRTWYLHIKEVRESDRGWYMCQINTDPMKSQVGYLNVVVPPDILDYKTSADMIVQDGANVSLRCVARGSPEPSITWKRESGEHIRLGVSNEVASVEGSELNINRVTREQMGPYLCIATNGIPPSVSKRIMLIVHFPPLIWIEYQLLGAHDSQQIVLECNSEAFPKSINYWTRDKGEIVPQNEKYQPILIQDAYKVHMKLIINNIDTADYGIYKCISKNAIGETDSTINVYRIPKPALLNKTSNSKTKSSNIINQSLNDVTYHTSSSKKDQPDSLFLEENKNHAHCIIFNKYVYIIIVYLSISLNW